MLIPSSYPHSRAGDRLGKRRIRIGLKFQNSPIVEYVLEPEADVIFGAGGPGVFAVPGWTGANLCLLSRGRWLALGPGMRLHMCHETGEDRMQGSFEELSHAGVSFPIYINVSRLNVRVNEALTMLMEYMPTPGGTSPSESSPTE